MLFVKAILMGILQGMTEFLPVSSSGHLAIVEKLLGAKQPGISFEVFVHTGTLAAILYAFRGRIRSLVDSLRTPREETYAEDRRLIYMLFLASLPALLVAVLWKSQLEGFFTNLDVVAGGLIFTGLILFLSRFGQPRSTPLAYSVALMIGVAQAAALIPGISRSGATISVALLLGLGREKAAEFSFLLAVPAIVGATGWQIANIVSAGGIERGELIFHLIGFAAAAGSGLLAIKVVLRSVRAKKFRHFAYYCWALGIAVFAVL